MIASTSALASVLLVLPQTRPAWQSQPGADSKLERLLEEVTAATRSIKAMTAKFTVRDPVPMAKAEWVELEASVRLKRPFFARIDIENPAGEFGPRPATVAADGVRLWVLHRAPEGLRYSEGPVDAQGRGIAATSVALIDFYCDPRRERLFRGPDSTLRLLGERTVDGVAYQVVEAVRPGKLAWRCEVFVDPGGLVRRMVEEFDMLSTSYGPAGKKQELGRSRIETRLVEIALGVPTKAADFTYEPPEGASPIEPRGPGTPSTLLEVGEPAPPFEVPLRAGGTVSLDRLIAGRKAALLVFWRCPCPTCPTSLQWIAKLQGETRGGLATLAVNLGDMRKVVDHFLEGTKDLPDIGLTEEEEKDFALRRAYGVPGYPTVYLVDGAGKVVYRALGCPEQEILAALGRMGLR